MQNEEKLRQLKYRASEKAEEVRSVLEQKGKDKDEI